MTYVSSQAELDAAPRRVTVLGSTGSVGCNTLELLERQPKAFRVEALTAHSSVSLLAEQARRVHPRLAVIADAGLYGELKDALAGSGVTAAAGEAALIEAAERPADFVMSAIVGAAGLEPTLAAVRRGAVVGLANKETPLPSHLKRKRLNHRKSLKQRKYPKPSNLKRHFLPRNSRWIWAMA